MKIKVTMKDPDTLQDAIIDAFKNLSIDGVNDEEIEAIRQRRGEAINDMATRKWFEYGEYLTVEIDTEAQTCIVVPNGG